MNPPNICFYSNQDRWSKAFIDELSKTPWIREFQFICVDPSPNRPKLPTWLKQVPTLVIKGDETPVKVDTEVMNWLYEKKMKEGPKQSKGTGGQGPIPDGMPGGEPMSWMPGEMEGTGNSGYSYVDDMTGSASSVNNQGSFSFLQGAAAPGDRQMQSNGLANDIRQQSSRSKKEVQFDNQMEMYIQQRDAGIPKGPARQ
jgi:hypothetical protein